MLERRPQPVVDLALRPVGAGHLPEHRRVLSEIDRDAVEPGPDPDDLAGRAELVELGRLIPGNAPRQDIGLPERDRQRKRLQRDQGLA